MMGEAQALVKQLLSLQNPDGGWPFRAGSSWVEPTAFSILALQSQDDAFCHSAVNRGISWLLCQQQPSGGWVPNAAVKECTWVSSIATLAILRGAHGQPTAKLEAALNWTAGQVYSDDLSLSLLLARALNLPPAHAPGSVAWYPGTAGWVTPTALSSLVLMQAGKAMRRPELCQIAARSCVYLLSRRCADDGWNHGGSKTRSEDATSYPETTGLALLALRGASITQPPSAVTVARKFATNPESIEGLAWIQMALQSASLPIPDPTVMPKPRTTRDTALRMLSLAAANGKNVFLDT